MFETDKEGRYVNNCEDCPGHKRALLQCHYTPSEYEAAKVPIDLLGDHAKIEGWALDIDERSFEEEQALEVAQAFMQQTYIKDDDKETCFKLIPQNAFAVGYVVSYRTDGNGAPLLRVAGGTYDQIRRDLQADNIIHGVMKDGERRRASKAGSTG